MPFKIGIIGCGDVAERGHLPAILEHPDYDLVALCDLVRERAALLASRGGSLPVYEDYRELLASHDLDGVVLAVHPEQSIEIVIDCLRRKLPVLDEKPLATSEKDGLKVVREVENRNGAYQIGFCFRYSPWVDHLRRFSTRIGKPAQYRVSIFDEQLDRSESTHFGRIQQILENSSAIVHEGSHVIDYFHQWTSAKLVSVRALAARTESDLKGSNLWSCQFSLNDGSTLHLEIGWLLRETPPCKAELTGPAGYAEFNYDGEGVGVIEGRSIEEEIPPCTPCFSLQLDAFAETIRTGQSGIATVQDGLRALLVTKACEESARTGRVVEIRGI